MDKLGCFLKYSHCFLKHLALLRNLNLNILLLRDFQNCGVVVEANIIDERSEWRTFTDSVSSQ